MELLSLLAFDRASWVFDRSLVNQQRFESHSDKSFLIGYLSVIGNLIIGDLSSIFSNTQHQYWCWKYPAVLSNANFWCWIYFK